VIGSEVGQSTDAAVVRFTHLAVAADVYCNVVTTSTCTEDSVL